MWGKSELIRHRFDDFCEKVRGWDMNLRRFDREPFEAELLQTVIGPLQFSRARFEGQLQQLGTPPPGVWTFGIPEPTSTSFVWRGYEIDPEQVLVFRPGSGTSNTSFHRESWRACSRGPTFAPRVRSGPESKRWIEPWPTSPTMGTLR